MAKLKCNQCGLRCVRCNKRTACIDRDDGVCDACERQSVVIINIARIVFWVVVILGGLLSLAALILVIKLFTGQVG